MTRLSTHQVAAADGPFGLGICVERPVAVPEGSVATLLRVPPELSGMRTDRFVQTQLKRTSRTRAAAIVARGAYGPEGRPLRPGDRVRAEQLVVLWRAPWDETAPDVTLPVLYEDEHLLAVNKPAGTPVHPTARYHKSTVIKLLEAARGGERLRLSHRLDRETSGVLLLARNANADRRVKMQLAARDRTLKQYLAVTWGWPEQVRLRVDLPVELDPASRYKVKMRVAAPGTGLASATRCDTLDRRVRLGSGRRYALVRCTLETGRQHQIRLHLAARGTPIVGDKLYGPDDALFARGADGLLTAEDRAVLELERHGLHAELLELDHPVTGERLRIHAPLATDLRAFWESLEPSEPG